jgi:DNA primase
MARIPEQEIERLKSEVSVQRLAEARGIKFDRNGTDLIGLCPFHDDKEPSLVISPGKNLWHCLGTCRTGGSVIDWVMKCQGVSFRHAVELLRANHPSLAAPGPIVRKGTTVKLATPFSVDADDQRALNRVADYYHQTLKQSPEALKYLQVRGLEHPEMIEHLRLGFSNRTLCYHLPEGNRKDGAVIRGRLQRIGILRESGHEHFTGSIVIPVMDLDGNVTEIYGRKITESLRPGTRLHTYLPGPHKGIWNEEALRVSKDIILCKSLIDALTFWCADYRNVTASYGVNGFTEEHRKAFKKHGIKKVLIAYDRDEAGEKAAIELGNELIAMGIDCYRVLFPKGMDANAYGRKIRPATKSLGILLNKVEWLGKGKGPSVAVKETIEIEKTTETERLPAAKEKEAEVSPSVTETQPIDMIEPSIEIKGDEITIMQGDRRYRIRGLAKNLSHDILKVNLLVTCGDAMHVDTLDFNVDRQRIVFAKRAAEELNVNEDVIRKDLGRVFLQLEILRNEQIRKALDPKEAEVELSAEEEAAAMELLNDPNLLQRILDDFARCGIVGEETNKLVGYLASISRRLESPLAVIVQSSSAAGKSMLMDAILGFVPEEDKVQYSAMTGQALFYMGAMDLKHKVLAITEEEGATRAAYALKLLQSEGVLTIASTGKDPTTGKLVTHQYRVEGPVMILLTTTAIEIDEELLNRCLVLTVNEDRSQTQAIHKQQREQQTLEGLLAKNDRSNILKVHRNAQRLLKPVFIANPFARDLTFLDSQTRTRRDHMKYLTLIRSIALLHQYQRPVKTTEHHGKTIAYLEVTLEDIEMANCLAHEVLGKSLEELPPQTRRLLLMVDEMVTAECERLQMDRTDYRFSRRHIRQYTGWGNTQLKTHLARLEDLEYLLVHHGGRGQSFVYELMFERSAHDHNPVLPGLIDVDKLTYDENQSGLDGNKSGSSRSQVGRVSESGRRKPDLVLAGLRSRFSRLSGKNTDTRMREEESVVVIAAGAR